MDFPSNAYTVETLDSGLTPRTIPGWCSNAQNEVSVENVPAKREGYEWYVLRASYGREDRAAKLLADLQATPYIACHTVYTRTESGVKPVIKKLLPNLVFAYLSKADAMLFTKGPNSQRTLLNNRTREEQKLIAELSAIVSYYYNHFEHDHYGKNPPLTVPYRQMQDFIIATSTQKDVMPVKEQQFQIGEEVEVVVGEFKGLRGRVIRQQRNKRKLFVQLHNNAPIPPEQADGKRLIFQLSCLGSFSSALIPAAYFRKVE